VAAAPKKGKGRKVKKKVEPLGVAHVKSSFNNTLITITDMQGNVISWSSGGKVGNKGSRKSTAFAAQQAARQCADDVLALGMKRVEIWVKGPGSGREAAIRSLKASQLDIARIKDVTAVPHNGTRQPRRRR
jgi:small subunit ribosomal protein S11